MTHGRVLARMTGLVLALTGLAGCGQQVAGAPSTSAADPSRSALASFDLCTVLSDDELRALGIQVETREPLDLLGQVGCQYSGEPFGLSLERDAEETVSEYAERPENYVSFRRNEVNGRTGAQIQVRPNREDCAQVMNAGAGSVLVGVSANTSNFTIDPCAEALRIAKMIEPELPAVGS